MIVCRLIVGSLACLLVAVTASCHHRQPPATGVTLHRSPDSVRLITADIPRFWKAFDDAALIGEAERLCEKFARAPTVGLALTKRALDAAETNDLATQLDLERDLQREAGQTPDFAEGVRAFLEKRAPAFTGKRSA